MTVAKRVVRQRGGMNSASMFRCKRAQRKRRHLISEHMLDSVEQETTDNIKSKGIRGITRNTKRRDRRGRRRKRRQRRGGRRGRRRRERENIRGREMAIRIRTNKHDVAPRACANSYTMSSSRIA